MSPAQPQTLSLARAAIAAAWGVLLWLAVALLIRVAPPPLFARGAWTVLLFAAAIPNAWATVWLTRRLFALPTPQFVTAIMLACAAAMLCDGIALTWTPLYGPATKDLVPVGAILLWGVGWTLFATAHHAYRPSSLQHDPVSDVP